MALQRYKLTSFGSRLPIHFFMGAPDWCPSGDRLAGDCRSLISQNGSLATFFTYSHWRIDRFNVRECSDGLWGKTPIGAYIESRAHMLNRFGKVDCTSPKSAECLTGCSLSAGPLQRHAVKSMYVGLQEPCILHSQPLRKTCRETFSRWIEE